MHAHWHHGKRTQSLLNLHPLSWVDYYELLCYSSFHKMFRIKCHICGESKQVMLIWLTSSEHGWKYLSQASTLSLEKHTLVRLQAWCETEFWTTKANFLLARQSNLKHVEWKQPGFSPEFISLCFIQELKLSQR